MRIVLWQGEAACIGRIQTVLAAAVGDPSEGGLTRLLNETYRASGARLDVIWDGAEIIGVIGSRARGPELAEILHLAVDAPYRGRGWGRTAVRHLGTAVYPDRSLMAETDQDAVGFYARLGFSIEPLGEKYPGRERFRCILGGSGD